MFNLFNSKTSFLHSGALKGATDWHCHLLPGIDDGIQTLDDSLATLQLFEKAGIFEVWFTPHIMEDIPNETSALRKLFAEVKEAYLHDYEDRKQKGANVHEKPITLHLAAENMLDNLFEERFNAKDLLPIGADANMLLVETSYYNPPIDLWGTLRDILGAGYYPLLAHPERYRYMDDADYENLHKLGVRLQLNLSSLFGAYGPGAQKRSLKLLKKGYYYCCGTDTHRFQQAEISLAGKFLKKDVLEEVSQLALMNRN